MEDHLEEPTLGETLEEPSVSMAAYASYALRTLGGLPSRGVPEKNYGVSQRPPSPILVGLFLSISHPCVMIVQSANLCGLLQRQPKQRN